MCRDLIGIRRPWLGYLAGCLSALIMGLSWYATKRIGQIHEGAYVLDILSLRYLISGGVYFLAWRTGAIRLNYRGKSIWPLIRLSLLMPILYNILEYSALSYISSAEIGMLCSLSTVVASLLGYFMLGEPISAREGGFMALAVSGVILTNVMEFDPYSSSNLGRLMMLGCVLCSSLNRIEARRADRTFTSAEITGIMMWSSAAVMTVLSLGRHLIRGDLEQYRSLAADSGIYGYLFFLSVGCSLFGFLLSNVAISNLSMTHSSVLITLSTVVAVVSGAVLLREPLAWYDFLGCGVIMAGVIGCNLSKYGGQESVSPGTERKESHEH